MQFGVIATIGDPAEAAGLAAAAEASGWDGVFTWDGIAVSDGPTYDPWVVLAAMAMRTERVRLGAILTPPARRRPWKLARETMSVDRLSRGRLVLPVGLGALDDAAFANVGEPIEARIRAERLDESLEILTGLWSGEAFAFEGRHYRFGPMTFRPTPVQRPRIPIWVAATVSSQRSIGRALHWDGILPQTAEVETIRDLAERGRSDRPPEASPWEIVVEGTTAPESASDLARVADLAGAGATWWVESDWAAVAVDDVRRRIDAGPPRK